MLMPMEQDQSRRKLLEAWGELNDAGKENLRLYAEFLLQRQRGEVTPEPVPSEPLPIPRPETESAVAALKRLKKTYPMIDADQGLLAEASQLLMLKVMGTPDPEVIDRMETLFQQRYASWSAAQRDS